MGEFLAHANTERRTKGTASGILKFCWSVALWASSGLFCVFNSVLSSSEECHEAKLIILVFLSSPKNVTRVNCSFMCFLPRPPLPAFLLFFGPFVLGFPLRGQLRGDKPRSLPLCCVGVFDPGRPHPGGSLRFRASERELMADGLRLLSEWESRRLMA